ncbi:hypothetical protein MRX96_059916 [Rhipicephalus microplus]
MSRKPPSKSTGGLLRAGDHLTLRRHRDNRRFDYGPVVFDGATLQTSSHVARVENRFAPARHLRDSNNRRVSLKHRLTPRDPDEGTSAAKKGNFSSALAQGVERGGAHGELVQRALHFSAVANTVLPLAGHSPLGKLHGRHAEPSNHHQLERKSCLLRKHK